MSFDRIAREILAEAQATDETDELYGEARGDELPEQLRTPEGRREFFRQARRERQRGDEERLTKSLGDAVAGLVYALLGVNWPLES